MTFPLQIRNGPGMLETEKRTFANYLDGLAKLAKWKFPGNGSATFTWKFINSTVYQYAREKGDLAPYLTFRKVIPHFDEVDTIKAFQNNMDNMNVNVINYTDKYIAAINDVRQLYLINPTNVETIGRRLADLPTASYPFGLINSMASAHPLPEAGTEHHFDFINSFSYLPGVKSRVTLVRVKSTMERETVAQWEVDKVSYMHSFSVTPKYVIMFAAPYFIDMLQMMKTGEVVGGMKWENGTDTTIYVIEIATGKIHTLKTPTVMVVHHINAFETGDGEISLDVPAQDNPFFFSNFDFSYLRNTSNHKSGQYNGRIRRYHININTGKVDIEAFPLNQTCPGADMLELPTINENYRFKEYCYVYGQVIEFDNKDFSHVAIAKRDVCGKQRDRLLYIPNHYPSEAWFVPNPTGTDEEDGVLMAPFYDGEKDATYLAVIDPVTLTIISKSYVPTRIPFSFHGKYFKDMQ